MSFSTYSNDFYDFKRFFYDEVIYKTDFFKETIIEISQNGITKTKQSHKINSHKNYEKLLQLEDNRSLFEVYLE